MASFELNIPYTLTGPNGTAAVFNDQTSGNYVGMITELTGLDSPDVRESASDLVEFDGGAHGSFYYGRRPVVVTGIILNPTSVANRNSRMDRLSGASDAMRGDSVLDWTPTGGIRSKLLLRRQQPLRFTGGWQKEFQLAMVSADARIYSYAASNLTKFTSAGGNVAPTNAGTITTWPIFTITGPINSPIITNTVTGEDLRFSNNLAAGSTMIIDTLNRTIKSGATNLYGSLTFATSEWFGMLPGANSFTLSGSSTTAATQLRVDWNDAWL
jgi:hypothetical protein